MITYQAPAKLNLSLLVEPPLPSGYHPIRSLAQTVDWFDLVRVAEGQGEDSLEVSGAVIDTEENLVARAVEAMRDLHPVPPLSIALEKHLPVAAGLGGGSSDAAAALRAVEELSGADPSLADEVAPRLGSDVPLFLVGGSVEVGGTGERVERLSPLGGFALAIVVPDLQLATADVYRRWDTLEGPEGDEVPEVYLPPSLRGLVPMRNDLLPAALDLVPELGDFMGDVRSIWGAAVCLTGSGGACFGYFPTVDEAMEAAASASHLCESAVGVELRDRGVAPV